MNDIETPGEGHNSSVSAPLIDLDIDAIKRRLPKEYAALLSLRDERAAGLERWKDQHRVRTPVRNDDGTLAIAANGDPIEIESFVISDRQDMAMSGAFVVQLRAFVGNKGEVERAREELNRPLITAGKTLMGFFRDIVAAPVQFGMDTIIAAQKAFATEEAERERQRLREAAHAAEESAHRLAEDGKFDDAEQFEQASIEAAHEAETSKVSDLTRVRSTLGTVTTALTVWTFEIERPNIVPPAYCSPDNTKIQAAISAGVREIPGVRIFEKTSVRNL